MACFNRDECFETMDDLRDRLRMFSLTNKCPYFISRSNRNRLEARCPCTKQSNESSDNCCFRITAYRHEDSFIHLSDIQIKHSIGCTATTTASGHAVKELAKPYLANFAIVKPKDICNIIKHDYGASSTYATAWRALSKLKLENQLEEDKSFMLIDDFLSQFKTKNPGTVTVFERNIDNTFWRAFLCPVSSKFVFSNCRPIVIVDACHLRSRYGGVIMSACTHDGESHIVPLAIGIGPIENEENWRFFLMNLRQAIPNLCRSDIVIMHDRQKGIENAQSSILPNTYESICVYHLEKNVNAMYKSKFMGKIWAAARAFSDREFDVALNAIKEKNSEAAKYLMASNPAKWARCKFPLPRFGCITSNSAESMNAWFEDIRNKSHFKIFVGWVSKLSQLLFKRNQEYAQLNTALPPGIQQRLIKNLNEGMRRQIIQYTENEFESTDLNTGDQCLVNLQEKKCTCGEFTEFRFPCIHAAAAIGKAYLSALDFIAPSYTVSALRSAYKILITPVSISDLKSDNRTRPPVILKKSGRPKSAFVRYRSKVDPEDQPMCSQCKTKGHNKRTCDRRQRSRPGDVPVRS